MLKRKLQERNEYLSSKEVKADKENVKKRQLEDALKTNSKIPHHLRAEAKDLLNDMIYDIEETETVYRPPKVAVTTSHSPSSSLKSFAKHLALIFDGFHLMRGGMSEQDLSEYCQTHEITHLIIFRESKGSPSSIVFSKFPHGPTHYFSLFNVKYQRRIKPMGEKAYLVVDGMNTDLGKALKLNLSLCFPKVPEASRLVAFVNRNGTLAFRHFLIEQRKLVKECEFDMKLYKVVNSTFDMDGNIDYTLKSFMNSTKNDVLYEQKSE